MSPPLPTNPVWWGWMHAISSYRGNRPTNTQTQPQIHRQDQLQYTVVPQVAGRSISQCLSIIYITKYWFLITFCFLGGGAYISGYAVAICILFRSVFFILLYIMSQKIRASLVFMTTSANKDQFSHFFTVKFRKDLRKKNGLKPPPPLKSVAALPCET